MRNAHGNATHNRQLHTAHRTRHQVTRRSGCRNYSGWHWGLGLDRTRSSRLARSEQQHPAKAAGTVPVKPPPQPLLHAEGGLAPDVVNVLLDRQLVGHVVSRVPRVQLVDPRVEHLNYGCQLRRSIATFNYICHSRPGCVSAPGGGG
jgi:hypothetical protein